MTSQILAGLLCAGVVDIWLAIGIAWDLWQERRR